MTISSPVKRATTERPAAAGLLVSALVSALLSCGGESRAAADPAIAGVSAASDRSTAPVDFRFDSLDDRPVSAEATRGKLTVIEFLTTSSLPAQAQADFLVAMARHDGDRVNYAAVALEAREERELVELYRKSLAIPFPVAMADAATRIGGGAFGDVSAVPVTVLLDREGKVVWRADGRVAKSDELRGVMRGK